MFCTCLVESALSWSCRPQGWGPLARPAKQPVVWMLCSTRAAGLSCMQRPWAWDAAAWVKDMSFSWARTLLAGVKGSLPPRSLWHYWLCGFRCAE